MCVAGFIRRFYYSGNEFNGKNTVVVVVSFLIQLNPRAQNVSRPWRTMQLVISKPCPQKGMHINFKICFQTFQFSLNLISTKPQFAKIFRYDITEAQIIQNRGFRSTLICVKTKKTQKGTTKKQKSNNLMMPSVRSVSLSIYIYTTSRQHSCVKGPLWQCLCAGILWTTPLLRATCMRSFDTGRVSCVAA